MVNDFIKRVRSALSKPNIPLGAVARKANLHRNALYGFERDGWNPTADTLRKLEPEIVAIEKGEWQPPERSAA